MFWQERFLIVIRRTLPSPKYVAQTEGAILREPATLLPEASRHETELATLSDKKDIYPFGRTPFEPSAMPATEWR